MNSAYKKMCDTIFARNMIEPGAGVVLMVSGGSDSCALAYLMSRFRKENPGALKALTMFHMNHKLRGDDADGDALFVQKLADALEIPLFVCEMDIAAEAARCGGNVEAIARCERYAAANEALWSMCEHEGAPLSVSRIFTAHTADDRIENLYMRTIVGTGPGGFRGMLYENGNVARPLLDCSRDELRAYIEELATGAGCGEELARGVGCDGQQQAGAVRDSAGALWREDATNAHTDRFRAYVRHEIVPKAREWNNSLDATLTRTMNLIADEDDMLHDMALSILKDCSKPILDVEGKDFAGEGIESIETCDNERATSCYREGAVLAPEFGTEPLPLQRRCVRIILKSMLGQEERIDTSAVDAIISAYENGIPKSGFVTNIQGDIAISANKQGVRIEPMSAFRARRKKD